MTSEYRHIPVLLTECIDALDLPDHPVFVDATLGFAGHSFEAAGSKLTKAQTLGVPVLDEAGLYALIREKSE